MQQPLFTSLPEDERRYLDDLFTRYRFSFQERRQMIETASDLVQWNMGPLSNWIDETKTARLQGTRRTKQLVADLLDAIEEERRKPTDYDTFFPTVRAKDTFRNMIIAPATIMGRCPCPVEGEKTRCCNLKTLDAVRQCAFGCSYCSIQSFYNGHGIEVVENLAERMETIELEEGIWHIGTGQSSDSLLWGNDYGTLDALAILAKRYPSLIVELKTKSCRTDWIEEVPLPPNIVATWSLNAPTIIEKEEHFTPSLERRLSAARKAADHHIPVGFHLHPLVHFKGWKEEYRSVVDAIVDSFSPDEVVMISLGTLTFTKAVLRQLRSHNQQSRILDMPLTEAAGKYSYPLEIKRRLFPEVYGFFPEAWKENGPFFYLCMEDPQLWMPTFGHAYEDNHSFEEAMHAAYRTKVEAIANAGHTTGDTRKHSR